MTTTELVAGRELDALVAERVMSEKVWRRHPITLAWFAGNSHAEEPIPHYSTSIEAAWQVVERRGLSVIQIHSGSWVAGVVDYPPGPEDGYVDSGVHYWAQANTAPLAICKAALTAVGKP